MGDNKRIRVYHWDISMFLSDFADQTLIFKFSMMPYIISLNIAAYKLIERQFLVKNSFHNTCQKIAKHFVLYMAWLIMIRR